MVPGHGARVRFLLGTNVGTYVNILFFQVPTPELGHGTKGYLGTLVFFVSEHDARVLSVNTALACLEFDGAQRYFGRYIL